MNISALWITVHRRCTIENIRNSFIRLPKSLRITVNWRTRLTCKGKKVFFLQLTRLKKPKLRHKNFNSEMYAHFLEIIVWRCHHIFKLFSKFFLHLGNDTKESKEEHIFLQMLTKYCSSVSEPRGHTSLKTLNFTLSLKFEDSTYQDKRSWYHTRPSHDELLYNPPLHISVPDYCTVGIVIFVPFHTWPNIQYTSNQRNRRFLNERYVFVFSKCETTLCFWILSSAMKMKA